MVLRYKNPDNAVHRNDEEPDAQGRASGPVVSEFVVVWYMERNREYPKHGKYNNETEIENRVGQTVHFCILT